MIIKVKTLVFCENFMSTKRSRNEGNMNYLVNFKNAFRTGYHSSFKITKFYSYKMSLLTSFVHVLELPTQNVRLQE